jgi:outer membrane protein TolC
MKKNKILIVFILLAIGFTSSKISFSQDTIEDQIILKDYSSLILPPIDSLFLSLESNPNIKAQDYRIIEQESVIKSQKREWINYLRFSSSYQYGYQGAESLVQGYLIPAYYQTAQNAQNLYHVGVSLTIPFGDVIDRGNKVKKEKIRLGQIQAEKEISINEQKFIIIELYNKANEQLNTYKNIAEAKSYAELKTRIIQKDFINGIINIDELTDAKKSESDIFSNYEKAKSELMVALMKLEIICNYKFHIIKQL